MDLVEKTVLNQVRDSIAAAIKSSLEGYNSPMQKLVIDVVNKNSEQVKSLVTEAIEGVVLEKDFRQSVIKQIQHTVARQLTTAFGESVFKRHMDVMKSDPTLRARCVLAIEKIVEQAQK